jgi:hypothetical protein
MKEENRTFNRFAAADTKNSLATRNYQLFTLEDVR